MIMKCMKPLAQLGFAFLTACASNQIQFDDEIRRDGCFSETYRTWTKDGQKVGSERLGSTWDEECGVVTGREERKDISYQIIAKAAGSEIGSPEMRTEATRKILAAISYDNPDLFIARAQLAKEGITAEQLLSREADSLLERIKSSTDANDAHEARGELLSIYEGKAYPLHTETARPIIDAALQKHEMALQDVQDAYLGKQTPVLSCETVDGTLVCNY